MPGSIDQNDKTVCTGVRVPQFFKDLFLLLLLQQKKIYFISLAGNKVISVCIHEGLALHVSKVDSDVLMLWLLLKIRMPLFWWFGGYSKLSIPNNWYLINDYKKFAVRKMFLPQQNIVFEFTENTHLNRMWYHILILTSWKN